jgi:hypothetical protein
MVEFQRITMSSLACHQLTVREVAEEVGIFTGSCHTVLTEDLGMYWVSAKFIPRLLTDDLKSPPKSK